MIILKKIIWFCFLLAYSFCFSQAKKPNFVIVIADDHGVLHSTPYGSNIIQTPNMQKLADEGMRFDNAYVASPACAPSRAALFTGLMPYNNGIVGNHEMNLKQGVQSLIPSLIDQGYEVVFQGKVAHGGKNHHGGYIPNNVKVLKRSPRKDTKMSVVANFLKNRKDTRPLALFIGCIDTHTPFPPAGESRIKPEDVIINKRIYTTPEAQLEMSRYIQAAESIDTKLGNILKMSDIYLDKKNTMTVYTSDHGMAWPFAKWSLYETGIRTPLLISWPGKIQPNSTTKAMVSWIDLLPTMIDIADGTVPENIDGKPFTAVILGKKNKHRDAIYATHKGDNEKNVYPIRSVRVGKWKYIRNLHPEFAYTTHTDAWATEVPMTKLHANHAGHHWNSYIKAAKTDPAAANFLTDYHTNPAEELYNLELDPLEQHNLAELPEYSKKLKSLRKMISKRMIEVNDDESLSGPPKLLENFSIMESKIK
ncbi:sulfatase family protein [Algibacter lectus]|uniref:Putative sulfatase n=1 Tax=Algibacter lectus TaxID=221126 RepID=A0A4R8MJG4_9FLAO|nr:sulfatase [Algibacter lectus]MWW23216.1 sulfatase-like hydrolase/transferase [Algibacter lectus]TDY64105.1 putative sulfatase [Algibacter lectus]